MRPGVVAIVCPGQSSPDEVEQLTVALRASAGCEEIRWGTTTGDLQQFLQDGVAVAMIEMSVWQAGGAEVWHTMSKYEPQCGVIVTAQQKGSVLASPAGRARQEDVACRQAIRVLQEGVTDYLRSPVKEIEAVARRVQQCGGGLPYSDTGQGRERSDLALALVGEILWRCAQSTGTQETLQWSALCALFGRRRQVLHQLLMEEVAVPKEMLMIYGRFRVLWPVLREFPEVRIKDVVTWLGYPSAYALSVFCRRWLGASPRTLQQWMQRHGKIYEWHKTDKGLWVPCVPSSEVMRRAQCGKGF